MPRFINYMRVSVTDRCNLRCNYCVPKEGIALFPKSEILSFEEIKRLVKIFSSLGGKKIRLTGGEPLLRSRLSSLISQLVRINGIEKVCLTTNGVLLPRYALELKESGLKQINVSLDSLNRKKFKAIASKDKLIDVLNGIELINDGNFKDSKLNTVIMKGINDDEIFDFIEFAAKKGLTLRFLEYMKITPLWDEKYYLSVEKIKKTCKKRFSLKKIEQQDTGPAEYYKINGNRIGFIRTDRKNCSKCDRLRITSVGRMKVCLYEDQGIDLKHFLMNNSSDKEIAGIIKTKMELKEEVNYSKWKDSSIYMSSVGG